MRLIDNLINAEEGHWTFIKYNIGQFDDKSLLELLTSPATSISCIGFPAEVVIEIDPANLPEECRQDFVALDPSLPIQGFYVCLPEGSAGEFEVQFEWQQDQKVLHAEHISMSVSPSQDKSKITNEIEFQRHQVSDPIDDNPIILSVSDPRIPEGQRNFLLVVDEPRLSSDDNSPEIKLEIENLPLGTILTDLDNDRTLAVESNAPLDITGMSWKEGIDVLLPDGVFTSVVKLTASTFSEELSARIEDSAYMCIQRQWLPDSHKATLRTYRNRDIVVDLFEKFPLLREQFEERSDRNVSWMFRGSNARPMAEATDNEQTDNDPGSILPPATRVPSEEPGDQNADTVVGSFNIVTTNEQTDNDPGSTYLQITNDLVFSSDHLEPVETSEIYDQPILFCFSKANTDYSDYECDDRLYVELTLENDEDLIAPEIAVSDYVGWQSINEEIKIPLSTFPEKLERSSRSIDPNETPADVTTNLAGTYYDTVGLEGSNEGLGLRLVLENIPPNSELRSDNQSFVTTDQETNLVLKDPGNFGSDWNLDNLTIKLDPELQNIAEKIPLNIRASISLYEQIPKGGLNQLESGPEVLTSFSLIIAETPAIPIIELGSENTSSTITTSDEIVSLSDFSIIPMNEYGGDILTVEFSGLPQGTIIYDDMMSQIGLADSDQNSPVLNHESAPFSIRPPDGYEKFRASINVISTSKMNSDTVEVAQEFSVIRTWSSNRLRRSVRGIAGRPTLINLREWRNRYQELSSFGNINLTLPNADWAVEIDDALPSDQSETTLDFLGIRNPDIAQIVANTETDSPQELLFSIDTGAQNDATISIMYDVSIDAQISAPAITVNNVWGNIDEPIKLDLDIPCRLSDVYSVLEEDDIETRIVLNNIPAGVTASDGVRTFPLIENSDPESDFHSVDISGANLECLAITVPAEMELEIGVAASWDEHLSESSIRVSTFRVAPMIRTQNTSGIVGTEIPLTVSLSRRVEESDLITISGVPESATLSDGENSWSPDFLNDVLTDFGSWRLDRLSITFDEMPDDENVSLVISAQAERHDYKSTSNDRNLRVNTDASLIQQSVTKTLSITIYPSDYAPALVQRHFPTRDGALFLFANNEHIGFLQDEHSLFNPGYQDFTIDGWFHFNDSQLHRSKSVLFGYGSQYLQEEYLSDAPLGLAFWQLTSKAQTDLVTKESHRSFYFHIAQRFENSTSTSLGIQFEKVKLFEGWHHLTFRRENGEFHLHINGSPVHSTVREVGVTHNLELTTSGLLDQERVPVTFNMTTSECFPDLPRGMRIGFGHYLDHSVIVEQRRNGRSELDTAGLSGNLDELRIWNKSLAQTEIDQLVLHQVDSNTPNLIAAFGLDYSLENLRGDLKFLKWYTAYRDEQELYQLIEDRIRYVESSETEETDGSKASSQTKTEEKDNSDDKDENEEAGDKRSDLSEKIEQEIKDLLEKFSVKQYLTDLRYVLRRTTWTNEDVDWIVSDFNAFEELNSRAKFVSDMESLLPAPQFRDPAVVLNLPKPEVSIQCNLMENFTSRDAVLKKRDNAGGADAYYRLTLTAAYPPGAPGMLEDVTYWITADQELTFFCRNEFCELPAGERLEIRTYGNNEAIFSFKPLPDELEAPELRICTNFFESEDECIVFYPDQVLMTKFCQTSGSDLTNPANPNALLELSSDIDNPRGVTTEQADSVAQLMRNMAAPLANSHIEGTTMEHESEGANSTSLLPASSFRAISVDGALASVEKYLPKQEANQTWERSTDLCKSHFLKGHDVALNRFVNTAFHEDEIYSFDFEAKQCVCHDSDEFESVWGRAEETTVQLYLRQYGQIPGRAPETKKIGDRIKKFWSRVKKGVKKVVEYVVEIVEEVVDAVEDAVTKLVCFVVETVRDAINFLKDTFEKIFEAIVDIIEGIVNFFKAIFEFDDIKITKQVFAEYLNKSSDALTKSSNTIANSISQLSEKLFDTNRIHSELDSVFGAAFSPSPSSPTSKLAQDAMYIVQAVNDFIQGLVDKIFNIASKFAGKPVATILMKLEELFNELMALLMPGIPELSAEFVSAMDSDNTSGIDNDSEDKLLNSGGEIFEKIVPRLGSNDFANLGQVLYNELLGNSLEDLNGSAEPFTSLLERSIRPVFHQARIFQESNLEIPVLSDLFELLLGDKLSLKNISLWSGSFIVTVSSKTFNSGVAPYTQSDLDEIRRQEFSIFSSQLDQLEEILSRDNSPFGEKLSSETESTNFQLDVKGLGGQEESERGQEENERSIEILNYVSFGFVTLGSILWIVPQYYNKITNNVVDLDNNGISTQETIDRLGTKTAAIVKIMMGTLFVSGAAFSLPSPQPNEEEINLRCPSLVGFFTTAKTNDWVFYASGILNSLFLSLDTFLNYKRDTTDNYDDREKYYRRKTQLSNLFIILGLVRFGATFLFASEVYQQRKEIAIPGAIATISVIKQFHNSLIFILMAIDDRAGRKEYKKRYVGNNRRPDYSRSAAAKRLNNYMIAGWTANFALFLTKFITVEAMKEQYNNNTVGWISLTKWENCS